MQERDCAGALAKCLIPIWELHKTEKGMQLCNSNTTARTQNCSAVLASEQDG